MSTNEPQPLSRLRWAVPLLFAAGALGGWLVFASPEPLQAAIAQARAGEEGGCTALHSELAQRYRDHPEGIEAPAGLDEAVSHCIEQQIEAASAQAEPLAREQRLLLVADPEAVLQPAPAQLTRIEELVAPLPGALVEGKPRIRVRSVEVVGTLATAAARQLYRDYRVQLRACHARAQQASPQLAGDYRVGMEVDAQGVVTKVAAKPGEVDSPVLQSCLAMLFEGKQLDAGGRVTVELRLR